MFSYHLCVVDYWPVCSYWSDQRSLIPKFVLGCVSKLSVVCIQTVHTYLPPPQVCGRSWRECRSHLFASFDYFAWSKISFKLFVQSSFCWLLTCVYHIYWISVHLSKNLSLGVLENCQCDISKPAIRILFPHSFMEGHGEGASFCGFACNHQYIDCLQGSYSSSSILKLCG